MSQFPHDEFDDVAPYRAGETGKHRAPGVAAAAAPAAKTGAMKWVGLLAAFIVAVVAITWVTTQFGGDDDQAPTADPTDEEAAEEDDDNDDDDNGDDNGDGNGDDDGNDDDDEDINTDFNVIVYNYDGTPGVAGGVGEQLDGAGFNVVDQDNWDQGWTTCGETSPVVVHPPDEEELAEQIADEIDAATCPSEGWAEAELIAVAVGGESAP